MFDLSQNVPSAYATWSKKSRNLFVIHSIYLKGNDLDFHFIKSENFPLGKDIDFSSNQPATLYFAFDGGSSIFDAGFDIGELAS